MRLPEILAGKQSWKIWNMPTCSSSPLDDEGKWYRYHPLFAEVLQARLEQTHHNLVFDLHRQAEMARKQGMIDEAVIHALAGNDYEGAAQLIEGVAGNMLRQGSGASLIHWLDAMPEEVIHASPRLCLVRGWTFLWGSVLTSRA